MSGEIIYSPETMTYTLSNGTDRIKLPNWAHIVIKDEAEREIMPLNNKIEILSDALALARDENTKLRELVQDVMPIVCDGCHERLCEMLKEEHPFVTCSFADRMRELGVDA